MIKEIRRDHSDWTMIHREEKIYNSTVISYN